MTYATFDDVLKRYKPIRTLIGSEDTQVSSDDVSSIFIRDAQSFIDAHLSNKYTVPLSVVPAFITQMTADIAIFNILTDHMPDKPDYFQPRYDRAISMLMSISSGTLNIASATIVSTGDNEAWSSGVPYHTVFSPVLGPEQQSVDIDRVNAALDERVDDAGQDNSQ